MHVCLASMFILCIGGTFSFMHGCVCWYCFELIHVIDCLTSMLLGCLLLLGDISSSLIHVSMLIVEVSYWYLWLLLLMLVCSYSCFPSMIRLCLKWDCVLKDTSMLGVGSAIILFDHGWTYSCFLFLNRLLGECVGANSFVLK